MRRNNQHQIFYKKIKKKCEGRDETLMLNQGNVGDEEKKTT